MDSNRSLAKTRTARSVESISRTKIRPQTFGIWIAVTNIWSTPLLQSPSSNPGYYRY